MGVWLERNSRIFSDPDRSCEEVWGGVRFDASLWASATKLFCNYVLDLILLD